MGGDATQELVQVHGGNFRTNAARRAGVALELEETGRKGGTGAAGRSLAGSVLTLY